MARRRYLKLIPKNPRANERGAFLLNLSIFLIALGIMTGSSIKLYDLYRERKAEDKTLEHLSAVEDALMDFFKENGRFPCAASITDPPDDDSGNLKFGEAIGYVSYYNVCKDSHFNYEGTWLQNGRSGRTVRIGTVPTRTLGIDDKYMFDGWGHRIVYALDTDAASASYWQNSGDDPGAIYIIDDYELKTPLVPQDNLKDSLRLYKGQLNNLLKEESVTEPPGGAIYALIAPGQDPRGAYNFQGNLIQSCKIYTMAWENCDYSRTGANGDSVFVTRPYKQYGTGDSDFTATLRYKGKFQKGGNE